MNPRLYHDLAPWWSWITAAADYKEESECISAAFQEKLGQGKKALLDLGVGAAYHLSHIMKEFSVTGVDLAPEMLEKVRESFPEVVTIQGDMRTVRLPETFDAVLIHDSISYLLSEADIRATLQTAAIHLRAGGVLIMCPEWHCETFDGVTVSHRIEQRGPTSVTYIDYVYDPDPSDTTIESLMLILIQEAANLRVEQDRHTFGLFPRETWHNLVGQAGFSVETRPYVKDDRGCQLELIVAVRNDTPSGSS